MNGSIQEQVDAGIKGASETLSSKIIDGIKTFVSSKELNDVRAEMEKLIGELASARNDLGARDATIKDLNKQISDLKAEMATTAENHKKALEAANGSAGRKAAEMVAGQGMPIKEAPAGSSASGTPAADARKKYQELLNSDPRAAGAFYEKNKELLWS